MSDTSPHLLPIGRCAALACLMEVTAAKPGNVHRGADLDDLTYVDLVAAGIAIGPILELAPRRRLGETVLDAVRATRATVATNANLGIVLLITPLAKVAREIPLAEGIGTVLAEVAPQDATDVYEAIRTAQPGGLGKVDEADVAEPPSIGLIEAMRLAAERDMIARQYTTDFADVLDCVAPWLEASLGAGQSLATAIVHTQLRLMAKYPDSLIARRLGVAAAREAADRAATVLSGSGPEDARYHRGLEDFDFWLRSDRRRNPGTTADLLAAGLFVLLREGRLPAPFRFYGENPV